MLVGKDSAMSDSSETIVAIATASGAAGIGIVRLSGPDARRIAWKLCNKRLQPRQAHFVRFRDQHGALIDQGVAIHFPAPHSFTGEDVVELQAHGAMVVLNQLLRRCLSLGARSARAGEFSERAFLNGKIDLAQAEAIADLIASQSEAQARAALRSLDGAFSDEVNGLQQRLEMLRIYIEAAIDFPEEEIDFLADHRLLSDIASVRSALADLLDGSRRGQRLRDGLHTVLIGRPNAGKSSVLNALARSDRAIVTAQPGTTRDVLREHIDVDGVALTLVDTAGLRDSDDSIEREGMRRARMELQRADLVLLVSETDAPDPKLLQDVAQTADVLIVRNKIDRDGLSPDVQTESNGRTTIHVSARTGEGMQALRRELATRAGIGDGQQGFSARARHVEALERARLALAHARQSLVAADTLELTAEDLRQTQAALGEITGVVGVEDLLGRIFANFCIGK